MTPSGLIVPMGRHVLDVACMKLAELRSAVPWTKAMGMHVNVSVRELHEPGFVDGVRAALWGHGLDPSSLTLEIAETVLIDHEGPAAAALRQIDELGVRLCIDDFGAGYSSLNYFRMVPLKALKIDRVFVVGLGRQQQDGAIVAATLAFGVALGVEVTAEGIETRSQADELVALGCRYGQGYHFSRPVDAEAIESTLRHGAVVRRGLRIAESDAA